MEGKTCLLLYFSQFSSPRLLKPIPGEPFENINDLRSARCSSQRHFRSMGLLRPWTSRAELPNLPVPPLEKPGVTKMEAHSMKSRSPVSASADIDNPGPIEATMRNHINATTSTVRHASSFSRRRVTRLFSRLIPRLALRVTSEPAECMTISSCWWDFTAVLLNQRKPPDAGLGKSMVPKKDRGVPPCRSLLHVQASSHLYPSSRNLVPATLMERPMPGRASKQFLLAPELSIDPVSKQDSSSHCFEDELHSGMQGPTVAFKPTRSTRPHLAF
ncbi:hypothetical protein KC342_g42 [Hortaea werneckii]|nr:hypothetical protein KC342_g42 [Hortaea werneckii]